MTAGKYKIHEEDKFLSKMKKQWDKGNTDDEALRAKNTTMSKILEDNVRIPERLHFINKVGETSVRPKKPNENPLRGGNGHEFSEK